MSPYQTRASCDPFKAVNDLVDRLKSLQKMASEFNLGLPGSIGELLECLTIGTADRAGTYIDTNQNPYDAKALQSRVRLIFSNLQDSAETTADFLVGSKETPAYGRAARISGLWMSKDVANTFHGLAYANAENAVDDARDMIAQARLAQRLLDQIKAAALLVNESTLEDLARDVTTSKEEVSPELCAIAAELLATVESLRATGDLGESSCGATSLLERIAALLAILPSRSAPVVKVLRLASDLNSLAEPMQKLYESVMDTKELVPAFADQIELNSSVTITEIALYDALAQEFERVCQDVRYAAETNNPAEIQRLLPEVNEICAIAMETLSAKPEERVNRVRGHGAYPHYAHFSDQLRSIERPKKSPLDSMVDFQTSLAVAALGWNAQVFRSIEDLQGRVAAIENFGMQIESAGNQFMAVAKNEIDQLCVGILNRFLAMSGYEDLKRQFLYGLFGGIKDALRMSLTTAGALSKCLQELTGGDSSLLPGPQRFAIDRVTEATDAMQQASDFISETQQDIEGLMDEGSRQIDELLGSIKSEARTMLGPTPVAKGATVDEAKTAIGLPEPGGITKIGNATVQITPDGWVKWIEGQLPPYLRVMPYYHYVEITGKTREVPDGYEIPQPDEHGFITAQIRVKTAVKDAAVPAQQVIPRAAPSAVPDMERVHVPSPTTVTLVPRG